MTIGSVDIGRTRAFGMQSYMLRQVPIAAGVVLLGALVLFLSGDDDDARGLFLGWLLVGCGLVFGTWAFHRWTMPGKPILELSAGGILYRLARDKEFHIPWSEIRGLGLTEIDLGRGGKLRDVTVATVSQDFFDANVPIKGWWMRGPGWRYNFIRRDGGVAIAFHHDVFSVPAEELWNELETRWRAFSGRPDAPVLSIPRLPKGRHWFGGWTPSHAIRRVLLAAFVVLAPPAVFFWHWPVAWLLSPDMPSGAASFYLEKLLDGGGVEARLAGNGVVVLRAVDLTRAGPADCRTRLARDPRRTVWLPPYFTGTLLCSAPLTTAAGATATAVFKLIIETTRSPDWQGRMEEHRTWVPARLDAQEADAALCWLGFCATAA